jgi:DNA-binding transcriptional MerR regulator
MASIDDPQTTGNHSISQPEIPDEGLSIGEAARLSGLTVHALRFYEKSGMMPTVPARTHGGTRRYHAAELDWIHTCTKLRALGMSTDLIRRYVDLVRAGPGNESERLHLLETHRDQVRAQLTTLAEDLKLIEGKIVVYRERLEKGVADQLWSTPRDP